MPVVAPAPTPVVAPAPVPAEPSAEDQAAADEHASFMSGLNRTLGLDEPAPETTPPAPAGDPSPEPTEEPPAEPSVAPVADPTKGAVKPDPKDVAIESLQREVEMLRKPAAKPDVKPADKADIKSWTDSDIESTVAYIASDACDWSPEEKAKINLKATKELSVRSARAEAQKLEEGKQLEAMRTQSVQQLFTDFPQILKEVEGKKVIDQESPLFLLADRIFRDAPQLKDHPQGVYVATEIAHSRMLRAAEKAAAAKGPVTTPTAAPKTPPPAMRGKPPASPAASQDPKGTVKTKEVKEAEARFQESGSQRDLAEVLKRRLG